MNIEKHICIYCGAEAQYQLKNGKWCCCKSSNSCPANRALRKKASKAQWQKVKDMGLTQLKGTQTVDINKKYVPKIVQVPEGYCEYGCGNLANYTLKNGVRCCCEHANQCPVNRKKNSQGLKKAYLTGVRIPAKLLYENLDDDTKRRMNWRINNPHETKYKCCGFYKGYWCDSTWELVWIIYNLEHNIKFNRNRQGFIYEYNNTKYKYYPDFILEDGSYVEIKGIMTDKDKCKISQFPHKLTVLMYSDLVEMFEYVKYKYGSVYTSELSKMYEK